MNWYRNTPAYIDLVEERDFKASFVVLRKDIVVDGDKWVAPMIENAIKDVVEWSLEQGYIPNGEVRTHITDNYEEYSKEYTVVLTGARLK